jgi:transmembrane sensor
MNGTSLREARAIREAALDWVVQLNAEDLSAEDKAAFASWLRRSPAHVHEYLQAEATWQAMARASREVCSPIAQVMADVPAGVPEFPGATPEAERSSRARGWVWGAAAAAILTIAAAFGPSLYERLDPNRFATEVGETRQLMLADGSMLELNTRSKVRIDITETARNVFLDEGEAFFNVARDPHRVFNVYSGTAQIRAIGTQFNVYRQPKQTVVTVLEGRVAVTRAASQTRSAPGATELTAGTRVVVRSGQDPDTRRIQASPVDAAHAIAWRSRRLIFENEPLVTVVAEFNRYNERQLIIDSPVLASRRISGVFSANRPDALVDFLTQPGDVRAIALSGAKTRLTLAAP